MVDLQGFMPLLLSGAWITVKLALTSLFFGMILGLLGASAKLSKVWIFRKIAFVYTSVFRSIPDLLLVLFMYYGFSIVANAMLAELWQVFDSYTIMGYDMGSSPELQIDAFLAGVLTLSLTFGAYATETLRGAIQEIPQGQSEAAQAIGLNKNQIFFRIILPQVWKQALPGLGNLFLVLLKDTALVSVVGLNELLRQADVAKIATGEPFTFFFTAAIMYLVMTMIATVIMNRLQWLSDPAARYKDKSITSSKGVI